MREIQILGNQPQPWEGERMGQWENLLPGKTTGRQEIQIGLPLLLLGLVSSTREHMEDFGWSPKCPNPATAPEVHCALGQWVSH